MVTPEMLSDERLKLFPARRFLAVLNFAHERANALDAIASAQTQSLQQRLTTNTRARGATQARKNLLMEQASALLTRHGCLTTHTSWLSSLPPILYPIVYLYSCCCFFVSAPQ